MSWELSVVPKASNSCVFTSSRFTYEISPVFILMEKEVLGKMIKLIGWPEGEGDGIFAPGKSNCAQVRNRKLRSN